MTKWIHLSSRVMGNYHARFRIGGVSWQQLPRPYLHFGVNILCGLIAYCFQPKKPSLDLEKDLAQYT